MLNSLETKLSRRGAVAAILLPSMAPAVTPAATARIVKRHDQMVESLLNQQITDPVSAWCGGYPDNFGIVQPQSAGRIVNAFTAGFLHPQSKFYKDTLLLTRIRLASEHLDRRQNENGNIDLMITNFNSPPDTAFLVHSVASAANVARLHGEKQLVATTQRFLTRAGAALATGGVHTPNHRWVICSALAQIHELFPRDEYVRRIDQWLAEGIDIDEDGQFTERSTTVYNAVCDRALLVMAAKLQRWELLEPVRRNLNAMLYLLHPGYEVVTEISARQDAYQRGTMAPYWFPLQYLAVRDGNGQFAAVADHFASDAADLTTLLEYPDLEKAGPAPVAPPDNYEKVMPHIGIVRIRRGATSATLTLANSSRFLAVRRGEAVINAVRFASAFFGKGQFVPQTGVKRGDGYYLKQSINADYVQPLNPPRPVAAGEWGATRKERRKTEICQLEQSAVVTELKDGFRARIRAAGTNNVPIAVEINLRSGGTLEGCTPAPGVADAWILSSGNAIYKMGNDGIRIGGAAAPHRYTQIRGAEPKLSGPSVYVTGYTPFDHTLTFEWL